MLMCGRGQIVCINSVQGLLSIPFRSAYASSKHAMHAFCDSLRAELSGTGVGLLSVYPSYIRTNLSRNAITQTGEKHGRMDPSTEQGMEPRAVAGLVRQAMVDQEDELTVASTLARIAVQLRSLSPGLFHWAMSVRARKQLAQLATSD